MAYESYLLGYRMDSTEELLVEKAALKAQRTIFTQQQMGGKSMTRDLRLNEERLQAVNYVLRSRGSLEPIRPAINLGQGITDFSCNQ